MKRSALVILVVATALRCSPDQHAHPVPKPAPQRGPVLTAQDRDFLERANEGNNGEIAIGRLVRERAMRPEVAQFGEMMVNDHRAANGQLGAIARQYAIALGTSLGEHQSGYDRLVNRKGDPFDKEFMRVMIGDHQQAVLLYQGEVAGGVDPLLKQYAAQTLPKIQAHLAHAQSLAQLAEPRQEGTQPPTPDAKQKPPGSTAPREP